MQHHWAETSQRFDDNVMFLLVVFFPLDRRFSQRALQPEPAVSDNEDINKTFVNRNPRNLEQMALAVKDRGWATVWPSRQYYHRFVCIS